MKTKLLIILALAVCLLSMPAQAFILWGSPSWVGASEPNTITFGQSAQADSGAISASGDWVHYKAELIRPDGTVSVLDQHDVDTSSAVQHEYVTVSQASYGSTGSYTLRFTLQDPDETEVKYLHLTVNPEIPSNQCPVMNNIASQTVLEGNLLQFQVSATDADGNALTYGASGLPAGSSFNPSTRTFTWIPNYNQAGTYFVTFTVTDGTCSVSKQVQITVLQNSVPVVTLDATPTTVQEGGNVHFVCTASGGDMPLNYYIDFGDGSSATTNVADHVYMNSGVYVATCTVQDSNGDVGSDSVGITVTENNCPVLAPIGDKTVQAGNTLSFGVSASDADMDTLSYSATVPAGSSFNGASRTFTWATTVSNIGTHSATFRVTDGTCQDSETITIEVTGVPNQAPDANFNWTPANPMVNQPVTFTSTSTDPNGDALTCAWDFNNDGLTDSTSCTAVYTFSAPGSYPVTLTVSDGTFTDSITKIVSVTGQLNVTGISCFEHVIEGSMQACSVSVSGNGLPVGNVDVRLYYLNGSQITNCVTDFITGNCVATFPVGGVGNYTVYATADKPGWLPDLDTFPRFTFEVLARRYLISGLAVYNNSAFTQEDYDFFRGEDMYVHFAVFDNSGNPADNMVTSVTLVSPPGGMAAFTVFPHSYVAGNYWYWLRIPTTHDFLGDSQVFTFAFNFSDGSGAEMVVEVVIRNNPPVIDPAVVGQFNRTFNATTSIDLTPYEHDVEDSGSALQWSVLGVDSSVAQVFVDSEDVLTVVPVGLGSDVITLVLRDLDGDTDTIDVPIVVSGVPGAAECSNGVDDDGDGLVDMLDPGCASPSDDDETDMPVAQCSNGIDDDGDGLVDMLDPGCSNPLDNDETNTPVLPQCSNGVDDDGDGLVDMADPGCSAPSDNSEANSALPQCANGVDDDGDGLVDMLDPDCANPSDDTENHLPQCSDLVDNDGDGLVDMLDPDCSNPSDDTEHPVAPQCNNGLDDDGDGLVDMADPDCSSPTDNTENHLPQCSDGVDNDGDGLVDMADPDCFGPSDNNESLTAQGGLLNITVPENFRKDKLVISRIDINGYDVESAVVAPGKFIRLAIAIENDLGYDLEDLTVRASVDEFDLYDSNKLRELDDGDQATVLLVLEVPDYADSGVYDLRIVVSNDDIKRVKYRTIAVV